MLFEKQDYLSPIGILDHSFGGNQSRRKKTLNSNPHRSVDILQTYFVSSYFKYRLEWLLMIFLFSIYVLYIVLFAYS